jgi:hypothetical protein
MALKRIPTTSSGTELLNKTLPDGASATTTDGLG